MTLIRKIIYWLSPRLLAIGFISGQAVFATSSTDIHDCNQATTPKISIHCGKTPSVIFDKNDRLWAVFEQNQFIYLTYSDDFGKSYSPPVTVNSVAEKIYADGENRPKIAVGHNAEIYISWSKKTEGKYTGDIRFSRSVDNGKHFSPVKTINNDKLLTGHRFDSLKVNRDGQIFISWLDKRDKIYAKKSGNNYKGAAIYYTTSKDSGLSFAPDKKIADRSCVCCRIAMTETNDGKMAVLWRHIFNDKKLGDNIRDHAIAFIDDKNSSQIQRATVDNWKINACPHHGPSLTLGPDNNFHMVWFTASTDKKGLYYGAYNAREKTISAQIPLSQQASASHPYILYANKHLVLAWKEFDGKKSHIHYKYQKFNEKNNSFPGNTWISSKSVATSKKESDHPTLVASQNRTWLSWHTRAEGLKLIPLI